MVPDNLRENPVAAALAASAPDAVASGKTDYGELTLEIRPEQIEAVCAILKGQLGFVRLSGVTAVDWYPREPRFEVVYHLHSLETNSRLRLKCRLNSEASEIDSVTGVWRSANWYEREVFDLFGIRFRNHPDLKRIMMPDDWDGHPLRKDYPIHGHRYDYQNE